MGMDGELEEGTVMSVQVRCKLRLLVGCSVLPFPSPSSLHQLIFRSMPHGLIFCCIARFVLGRTSPIQVAALLQISRSTAYTPALTQEVQNTQHSGGEFCNLLLLPLF
jgi:hypothetical protein